jgi:hypothetical protein
VGKRHELDVTLEMRNLMRHKIVVMTKALEFEFKTSSSLSFSLRKILILEYLTDHDLRMQESKLRIT